MSGQKKVGPFSICACHACAGVMLIFSVISVLSSVSEETCSILVEPCLFMNDCPSLLKDESEMINKAKTKKKKKRKDRWLLNKLQTRWESEFVMSHDVMRFPEYS